MALAASEIRRSRAEDLLRVVDYDETEQRCPQSGDYLGDNHTAWKEGIHTDGHEQAQQSYHDVSTTAGEICLGAHGVDRQGNDQDCRERKDEQDRLCCVLCTDEPHYHTKAQRPKSQVHVVPWGRPHHPEVTLKESCASTAQTLAGSGHVKDQLGNHDPHGDVQDPDMLEDELLRLVSHKNERQADCEGEQQHHPEDPIHFLHESQPNVRWKVDVPARQLQDIQVWTFRARHLLRCCAVGAVGVVVGMVGVVGVLRIVRIRLLDIRRRSHHLALNHWKRSHAVGTALRYTRQVFSQDSR